MVITFEMIRDVHRKEKDSPSLQKLPDGFFAEVSEYLKAKESMKSDPANYIELENARMLVNAIIDRREHKVLEGAMVFVRSGIPLDNMIPQEKELFDAVVKILQKHREMFWEDIKSMAGIKEDVEAESGSESDDTPESDIPPELEQIEERLEILEDVEEKEPDFSGAYLALKDLPAFIWSDNRTYLIKEKDVLKLPADLAEFLEKKGALRKIKR